MKPDYYKILSRLVESGAGYGVHRSYKHSDTPDRDMMIETITSAIMSEISEEFVFDDRSES